MGTYQYEKEIFMSIIKNLIIHNKEIEYVIDWVLLKLFLVQERKNFTSTLLGFLAKLENWISIKQINKRKAYTFYYIFTYTW